jgi:hypothetical protein
MIPAKTQLQPVLFVEEVVEAIRGMDDGSKASTTAVSAVSNRLVVPFNKAEYYGVPDTAEQRVIFGGVGHEERVHNPGGRAYSGKPEPDAV